MLAVGCRLEWGEYSAEGQSMRLFPRNTGGGGGGRSHQLGSELRQRDQRQYRIEIHLEVILDKL